MNNRNPGKGFFSNTGRKCHVLRCLLIITTLLLLTACSELRVISGAAVKEIKADGINTEQTRYHLSKN